jgi:hypothetical protein
MSTTIVVIMVIFPIVLSRHMRGRSKRLVLVRRAVVAVAWVVRVVTAIAAADAVIPVRCAGRRISLI